MSKLDDIVDELYLNRPPFSSDDINELLDWQEDDLEKAKQQLKDFMLELINEEQDKHPSIMVATHSALHDLRKKVRAL